MFLINLLFQIFKRVSVDQCWHHCYRIRKEVGSSFWSLCIEQLSQLQFTPYSLTILLRGNRVLEINCKCQMQKISVTF